MKNNFYYENNGEEHCTYTIARMVVTIFEKRYDYAHLQKALN